MIWRSIIVWNKLSATISNGRSITVSERVVRMMVLEGGDEGRDTGEAEGADEGALCGGDHLEADGGRGGGLVVLGDEGLVPGVVLVAGVGLDEAGGLEVVGGGGGGPRT